MGKNDERFKRVNEEIRKIKDRDGGQDEDLSAICRELGEAWPGKFERLDGIERRLADLEAQVVRNRAFDALDRQEEPLDAGVLERVAVALEAEADRRAVALSKGPDFAGTVAAFSRTSPRDWRLAAEKVRGLVSTRKEQG